MPLAVSVQKKIGIVTITNDGNNYGNRLQNYAMQTVLQRMGFSVETLNRPIRFNQLDWRLQKKNFIHYIIPYKRRIEHIKAVHFYFWNKRFIKWSKAPVELNADCSYLSSQYDYFVAGSDQIWNPSFVWGKDPYMFLQFAKPKQRIAYAPSIGVNSIDENIIPLYKKWLLGWKALSCREIKGSEIINEILGKAVPTLLDPTFLLCRKDWERMTKGINTPKRYVFLYVLGQTADEYKDYINKITSESGLELVDVMSDVRYAGSSPSKFVALIQHAERVVADSYHAMVFAMIFHRPFTFFNRMGWGGVDMNSRFQTLLDLFAIKLNQLEAVTEITVDWDAFEAMLLVHQIRAEEYLKNAFLE